MPSLGLGFVGSGYSLNPGVNDVNFTEFDVYNGFDQTPNTVAIQPDGKIVVGGNFRTYNGIAVHYIARLNSNGTLDTSFTANAGTDVNGTVNSVVIQSDGKIICVGSFSIFQRWNF